MSDFLGFEVQNSPHHQPGLPDLRLNPICPKCLRKLTVIDCSREVIICEEGHEFEIDEAFDLCIPKLGASRN